MEIQTLGIRLGLITVGMSARTEEAGEEMAAIHKDMEGESDEKDMDLDHIH